MRRNLQDIPTAGRQHRKLRSGPETPCCPNVSRKHGYNDRNVCLGQCTGGIRQTERRFFVGTRRVLLSTVLCQRARTGRHSVGDTAACPSRRDTQKSVASISKMSSAPSTSGTDFVANEPFGMKVWGQSSTKKLPMIAGLRDDRETELAQSVELREMNPPPKSTSLKHKCDCVKVQPFAVMLQINYVILFTFC